MIREKDKLEITLSEGCYFDFCITGEKCEIIVKNAFTDRNYAKGDNPIIPEGFEYLLGDEETGFIIKDKETQIMFTWIKVGEIVPTGILYGSEREPFGRRFRKDEAIEFMEGEKVKKELLKQYISVKKYGGFYVSSHLLEYEEKKFGNLSYEKAFELSKNVIKRENVSTHLLYGAEYDTMYEWIGARGADPCDYDWEKIKVEEIRKKNIFFRDLNEWTQEEPSDTSLFKVLRRGSIREKLAKGVSFEGNACRVALLIK